MLSPLVIPDRDFARLAAGDGDSTAMKTLLIGHFSRRMLLLVGVLNSARHEAPGAVRVLEAAYALLADVQRTHPAVVTEVLTLPCVGNWAAACLRGGADEETYRYLACLAVTAAFRAERKFQIEVPVLDGTVCLPTLGSVAVLGEGVHSALVRIGDDGLTINAAGDTLGVPADIRDLVPAWQPARLLRTTANGHDLTIWLDDSDPFRAPPGLPLGTASPRRRLPAGSGPSIGRGVSLCDGTASTRTGCPLDCACSHRCAEEAGGAATVRQQ